MGTRVHLDSLNTRDRDAHVTVHTAQTPQNRGARGAYSPSLRLAGPQGHIGQGPQSLQLANMPVGGNPNPQPVPQRIRRSMTPRLLTNTERIAARRRVAKKTRATIKLASLNMRGRFTQGVDKWSHINQMVRDKKIGILALQ